MAETKTCCDDCDLTCAEHTIRWQLVEDIERRLEEIQRATEIRRTDIDRRLEMGVAQFSKIQNSITIFMALMLAMFAVAGLGYAGAISVKDALAVHSTNDSNEFVTMRNHFSYHERQESTETKQVEEVHNLSNLAITTQETLKSIEKRLGRIEEKL